MKNRKFNNGEWIITEGGNPAYFLYRLKKGKVSVFAEGKKINSIEIKEGDTPKILGIIAALGVSRFHFASIKAESEVEVETSYLDNFRSQVDSNLPETVREKVGQMIDAILLDNKVQSLQQKIFEKKGAALGHLSDIPGDISNALDELSALYNDVMARANTAYQH